MPEIRPDLDREALLAAMEALASGVSIADAEGRIVYSNPAADRILGMTRTDAPPSEWARHYGVLTPETEEPFPADRYPLVRALAGESVDHVGLLIRNEKLPHDVTLDCSARPITSGDGKVTGATVVFRDVTALERARAALERTNRELQATQRLKDDLTAFIVHDLKNPLTTIMALTDLIEGDEALDVGQVQADAGEIRAAAERMHRMVLDLLDLQLAEDGSLELDFASVPVAELLDEVAGSVRRRAPGVEVGHVPGGLTVRGDRSYLFRMLVNLVDNCVKYGPRDGRILLRGAEAGGVRISVEDEGPGVPEDLREIIFMKYSKLERDAGRRASDSRGLGLRFCRVVVDAHGGRIRVEDAEPRGARFVVTLPGA